MEGNLFSKRNCFKTAASQRAPLEIWELIAIHTPRYHLRTWLFVSPCHRDIASRHIFHTIDIYFEEEDQGSINRGLDIFNRAKNDPVFASRVKSLRLHWAYEDGNILNDMICTFKMFLPVLKALQHFEWIGCPDMHIETVPALLNTHKHLHGLGLVGIKFEAFGISAFDNLRNFTFSEKGEESDDEIREVRRVLDRNEHTLKHLTLGSALGHTWGLAFESVTIKNLTHLHLVGTSVSDFVLARIALAHNLQSLTLHGSFEDPDSASVVFANDRIIDGTHTLLPHLEAFRLLLEAQPSEPAFYDSVAHFLQRRDRLRRLDLGICPWDVVRGILASLRNLRVLGVLMLQESINFLIELIPTTMVAISLSVDNSDRPLDEYACHFTRFSTLSYLHLSFNHLITSQMCTKEFRAQVDKSARSIAATVPSLDFLLLSDEPYVVLRSHGDAVRTASVEVKKLPTEKNVEYERGVDLGEDAAWLEWKDVPMNYAHGWW